MNQLIQVLFTDTSCDRGTFTCRGSWWSMSCEVVCQSGICVSWLLWLLGLLHYTILRLWLLGWWFTLHHPRYVSSLPSLFFRAEKNSGLVNINFDTCIFTGFSSLNVDKFPLSPKLICTIILCDSVHWYLLGQTSLTDFNTGYRICKAKQIKFL